MKTVFYRMLGAVLVLAPVAGIILVAISGLSIMGCNPGVTTPELTTKLGDPPDKDVPQVSADAVSAETVGETVRVKGEVVQQCPATGCWFIVKDESGEVFVDLNPAGLRLTEKHEGEQTEVVGRVIKQGGEFKLAAQAIEFGIASETAEKNKP